MWDQEANQPLMQASKRMHLGLIRGELRGPVINMSPAGVYLQLPLRPLDCGLQLSGFGFGFGGRLRRRGLFNA